MGQNEFGAPMPVQTPAWQYVREARPGFVVEALTLGGTAFIYETTEYSRWTTFVKRFGDVCGGPLSRFSGVVAVQKLALEFFDRFVFDGAPTTANLSHLFARSIVAGFPPEVIAGEELFHVHRGWFEGTENKRVLINQNIEGQQAVFPDRVERRVATIYTKAERDEIHPGVAAEAVSDHLSLLHERNKATFRECLAVNARALVGL